MGAKTFFSRAKILCILLVLCLSFTVLIFSSGCKKSEKYIALTFDDVAPYYWRDSTVACLDMLEEKGEKATFYVVGSYLKEAEGENMPETTSLIKRISDAGHEMGNHSWTHSGRLNTFSEGALRDEMIATDRRISELLGQPDYETMSFRPPYGAFSAEMRNAAASLGKPVVFWGVDTKDWKDSISEKQIYKKIISGGGQIVLMHIQSQKTVDACARAIDKLKAEGYEFLTVTEILQRKGIELEAGKVIKKT